MNNRILILANNDIGLYNFRLELIERLLSEGNEVFISLPFGNRVKDLELLGCKFIETNIDRRGINPFKDIKLLSKYISIIKSIKPLVILTYTIKPNIYGGLAANLLNIPYIVNITGLGSAAGSNGLLQKIILNLYKLSLRKVHCIFFQNMDNLTFFEKNKIQCGKHKLIPGSGVNINRFSLLDYPNEENGIHFIFISRIMKAKGIDDYIEAAKYIKNKYPNIYFHIIGFCEEDYKDILDQLNNEGIIIYHGLQNDVQSYIAKTHCTIHPTFYPEGMSNVLLESASSGRPIITTKRSGCREIVDDKVTGYLFAERDTESLISKIEHFISLSNEKKKEMGIKGREKVIHEFNREIVVNNYIKEIQKNIPNN